MRTSHSEGRLATPSMCLFRFVFYSFILFIPVESGTFTTRKQAGPASPLSCNLKTQLQLLYSLKWFGLILIIVCSSSLSAVRHFWVFLGGLRLPKLLFLFLTFHTISFFLFKPYWFPSVTIIKHLHCPLTEQPTTEFKASHII